MALGGVGERGGKGVIRAPCGEGTTKAMAWPRDGGRNEALICLCEEARGSASNRYALR